MGPRARGRKRGPKGPQGARDLGKGFQNWKYGIPHEQIGLYGSQETFGRDGLPPPTKAIIYKTISVNSLFDVAH